MNGFINSLYKSTVMLSVPLILCSLGGLITFHSGMINVAMEGMMLSGAFTAVVVSFITRNPYLAMTAAMAIGVVFSLLYSLFVITLKTNNFAIGIAINIFVSSLTLFLTRIMFIGEDAFNSPDLVAIPKITVDFGSSIINTLFSDFSILVYLSLMLVVVVNFMVYKTPYGLWIRATGSCPAALSVAGKSTGMVQYTSSILSGMLCGLAGAQLSLSNVVLFSRNMTAGRGFICLAAILITKGKPYRVLVMSILFGLFNALAIHLQYFNIPTYFLSMVPYIMAIATMIMIDVKR